ncbi:YdgA family protein [Candidatus Pelagibacter sp.]|nr:YdgA family protein [Candidatus Pelagibacter sp.]
MKKFLVIIFVLVILGFIAQAYESASCKNRVERLKLTGIEAENEYKRCVSF